MAHFHQCDLVWWTASCLGDFFLLYPEFALEEAVESEEEP